MKRLFKIAAGALACATLGAPPAHAETQAALKSAAVGGSLLSWGWLAWQGAPLDAAQCTAPAGRGLRLEGGKDRELRSASLGWRLGECLAWRGQSHGLRLAPRLQLGAWQASRGEPRRLVDAAFMPALRWDLAALGEGMRLDLELGIGAGFISRSSIGDRQKSTRFQFFDVLGLGLRGADARWRLGLDYRHVSNADIRKPNQSVDFVGLSLEVAVP